jgi:anti-anti-sigma factor
MARLGIEREVLEDGRVVIRLSGELDLDTYRDFDAALRGPPIDDRPQVTIDLSGLTFMDSTGLRSLIEADRRARVSGASILLRRGPRAVQRVLELSGVAHQLSFAD